MAVSRPTARHALPTWAIKPPLGLARARLRLELRRALGHQRVAFADKGPALQLPGHEDLAALAKRVRYDPRVDHRDGGPLAAAIADREAQRGAGLLHRSGGDLAGQLDRAIRRDGMRQQLGWRAGLGRRAEARVDERGRQQHRGRQRHDQADLAFASGVQPARGYALRCSRPPGCPGPGHGARISRSRASLVARTTWRSWGCQWATVPGPPAWTWPSCSSSTSPSATIR